MSLRQSIQNAAAPESRTTKTTQPVKAREGVTVGVLSLRPMQKGSMLAFADLVCTLADGIHVQLNDCVLHEKDGQSWINLPSKRYQKHDGTTGYAPLVDLDEATKKAFQLAALSAIEKEVEGKSAASR